MIFTIRDKPFLVWKHEKCIQSQGPILDELCLLKDTLPHPSYILLREHKHRHSVVDTNLL